jgi:putative alpha-1,2-mannosidase
LEEGTFERYTHVLDTTDACLSVAQIVEDGAFRRRLLALGENWRRAYDGDGLMSEKSPYYEGDRYTYSFRVQKNMEERVALAGGKERFCEMLDAFFGFGGESVKQLTYLGAGKEIAESAHHRFEGFNNECDMETPYAYIYAGRHDRLCEILRECVHRSFGAGTSGLPGNNDSGGLSSLFVWNALGIFPISGSGEFLIGAPAVEEAKLTLAQGTLEIRVHRENGAQYRVKRVTWNGEEVSHFKLPMAKVAQGGVLEFTME